MSVPWTSADPTAPDAAPGRSDRADVIVVGGGLAGVAAALFLAEGGAEVLLLESRAAVGHAASGRHLGHVTTGLVEHPYRLVHALGEARAAELYAFSRRNHALLGARVPITGGAGWWAATDAREPDQLRRSAAALARLGVPARMVEGDGVSDALGTEGLDIALCFEEDGVIDPATAVSSLAAQAEAAGARIAVGHRVLQIGDDRGSVRVTVEEGGATRELRAEVVVFAANAWSRSVDPWFADKITPVREQALATAPIDATLPSPAGRAGYGYTFWRQLPDRRLLVGGCRWATPHLEVGEQDDTVVVERVQARIEAFLQRHLPAAGAPITHRWSWIVGHACDGLPIVGPMPGAPRHVACAGFCGNEPGLAVAAARGVADGLLGLQPPEVPDFLAASRFV